MMMMMICGSMGIQLYTVVFIAPLGVLVVVARKRRFFLSCFAGFQASTENISIWELVNHGALWLFAVLRLRNTLTYLLTYTEPHFTAMLLYIAPNACRIQCCLQLLCPASSRMHLVVRRGPFAVDLRELLIKLHFIIFVLLTLTTIRWWNEVVYESDKCKKTVVYLQLITAKRHIEKQQK